MLVSNRDFVYMTRTLYEDNKGFRSACSVDWDELPPVPNGYVRSTIHLAGWYAEKVSDNNLIIMYVNHTAPNGWLPPMVVNSKLLEYVSLKLLIF